MIKTLSNIFKQDTVTYFSCTMLLELVALSKSILLYSFRYKSSPSSCIGIRIAFSKSTLFKRRLLIVIFVVPVRKSLF